jgi:hypothetical protein
MFVIVVSIVRQKVGVDVELGIEVKAAQIKHLGQRHLTKMHHFLRRTWVHMLQAVLQGIELSGGYQIGFADEDLISKAHLTTRLLAVVQLLRGVFGVDQGQDGVEQKAFGNFIVHEKSLCHRAGVGQASGFNHHALEVEQAFAFFGGQQLQSGAQVFTNGATHATIAHLNDLLVGVRHQDVVVDVFFTKVVLPEPKKPVRMVAGINMNRPSKK